MSSSESTGFPISPQQGSVPVKQGFTDSGNELPEPQANKKIERVRPQLKREVLVGRQPINKQASRKPLSKDLEGPQKQMTDLGKKTLYRKATDEAEFSDELVTSEDIGEKAASSEKSMISDNSEDTTSSEMRVSTSGESTSLESPGEADKTPPRSRKGLSRSSSLQPPKLSRQRVNRSFTTPEERVEMRRKEFQECFQEAKKLDAKIIELKKEYDDSLSKLMDFKNNLTSEQNLNKLIYKFNNVHKKIDDFITQSHEHRDDDNINTQIESLTTHLINSLENKLQIVSSKIKGINEGTDIFKCVSNIQNAFTQLEHSIKNSPNEEVKEQKGNLSKKIKDLRLTQALQNKNDFRSLQHKIVMLKKIQQTLGTKLELLTNQPVLTANLAKSSNIANVQVEACSRFLQNENNSQNEFRRISQKLISSHALKQEVYNSYSDTKSEGVQKLQTLQESFKKLDKIDRDSETNPLKQNREYQNLMAEYDSNKEQLKLTKILNTFKKINIKEKNLEDLEAQLQSFVKKSQKELKEKYQLDLNQLLDKEKPLFSQYNVIFKAISSKVAELELKDFDLNSKLQAKEDEYYSSQQMELISNTLNANEKILFDFEVLAIKNENALAEFNAELYVQARAKIGSADPRELEKLRTEILKKEMSRIFPHEKSTEIYRTAIENVITNLK